jgi:hypothetical protein
MLRPMSESDRQPTEEELRAAYEAELKKVRVEDVVVQTVLSLINLAGRKAGLAPGSEDERDPAQLREAIDAVRALWPQVERILGPEAARLRDALSQLELAYVRDTGGEAGAPPAPEAPGAQPPKPEDPKSGPAQSSGRLWVPGQ